MGQFFRWLGIILNAMLDIAEDKPRWHYMSFNEAQEKLDNDEISMQEYVRIRNRKEGI